MAKTIRLAGDELVLEHVAHIPGQPRQEGAAWPAGLRRSGPGGLAYLAQLIGLGCGDLAPRLELHRPAVETNLTGEAVGTPRLLHVWAPYPRTTGSPEQVWRIERSLALLADSGEQAAAGGPAQPAAMAAEDPLADLLTLYDAGLGFTAERARWPAAVRGSSPAARDGEPGAGPEIILSTESPPGQGPLWQALIGQHADRLTVVLPVRSLRARHAAISQALSWDRTIEDLDRELVGGIAFSDLARAHRLVIYFPSAGAAVYERRKHGGLELERFIYHPEDLEGTWHARRPGRSLGAMHLLTAALTRHTLDPETYPLFLGIGRALAAIRLLHERGGGLVRGKDERSMLASFSPDLDPAELRRVFYPGPETPAAALPEAQFRTAFPRSALGAAQPGSSYEPRSDLLQDVTGRGYEYVAAVATQVVLQGISRTLLAAAPKARYGALVAVDREEIERINEIRNLMLSYRGDDAERRPLSIAVFGPPGSGKSFAIKQLARDLFGGAQEILEFNLSQFGSRGELHEAFNQVRDASVRGRVPLVFWDEFDTGGLVWLKEFLAPMQDAEYRSGGIAHPFGKAVFVFAGGTAADFQSFDRSAAPGPVGEQFRASKGPDFASRLRGYVNIKGPNPVPGPALVGGRERDVAHLIRRAVILRSVLERACPQLVDAATGRAAISPGVVRAFLRVETYYHGARSLEAVVGMSSLGGATQFGMSALPSPDLLGLHVSPDFARWAQEGELEETTIEHLAETTHRAWLQDRLASGWVHGPAQSDAAKTHPLLVEYQALSEADRERNRHSARVTLAKLRQAGFRVARASPGEARLSRLSEQERTRLAAVEHDIWLRDRLLNGYACAERRDDRLRLHPAVRPFEGLGQADQRLTYSIVDGALTALHSGGYELHRTVPEFGPLKVGVTGHRLLGDTASIAAGIDEALRRLHEAFGRRQLTALSALAEGADRLATEAILRQPEARLVAVLPLAREAYAAEFGAPGAVSRLHFEALLARAAEVLEAAPEAASPEDGYQAAAREIVERCDVLLAVWDGQGARGPGGTGEVVALARSLGRPLAVVRAASQAAATTEATTGPGPAAGTVVLEGVPV